MFAYVTVTYLATVEPKDVGLDDNCREEEFEKAIREIIKEEITPSFSIGAATLGENDIEVEVQEGNYYGD